MLKRIFVGIPFLCFVFISCGQAQKPNQEIEETSAPPSSKQVAITFDDLPAVDEPEDINEWQIIYDKLIHTLKTHSVPTIGFVNEKRLYRDGALDPKWVRLLEDWLNAGLEIGNHTYSHSDLHKVTLDEFKADILKGHEVTKELLETRGMRIRYFRHPYLHAGRDAQSQSELAHFLAENDYEVAPVTIDNEDYIFANAYEIAHTRGDVELKTRVGEAFVSYIKDKFIFFERNSDELFGRQIRQVLLLHGNRLNADYLDELVAMIRSLGYEFVSLETALADEAYVSEDTYVGKAGITWIHRWAITKGMPSEFYKDEPATPKFVSEIAN